MLLNGQKNSTQSKITLIIAIPDCVLFYAEEDIYLPNFYKKNVKTDYLSKQYVQIYFN